MALPAPLLAPFTVAMPQEPVIWPVWRMKALSGTVPGILSGSTPAFQFWWRARILPCH